MEKILEVANSTQQPLQDHDGIYGPVLRRISVMLPLLKGRRRRLYLACEAQTIGFGGIAEVSRISGISKTTIVRGLHELAARKPAAGTGEHGKRPERKRGLKRYYPNILEDLGNILENEGQRAENLLHYSTKSAAGISSELKEKGITISPAAVGNLLKKEGYNMRKAKNREGMKGGPGVEAQFIRINEEVRSCLMQGDPVLVIEAKELDRRRCGINPASYNHDYLERELGKPGPAAWYDLFRHRAYANAGLGDDTAGVAVDRLGKWYETEYFDRCRAAPRMLIIVDFCGHDGWMPKLRELAGRADKKITVMHFPPGITRWDNIEHRFYSFIGGGGLIHAAVIFNLIGPGGFTGATVEYCAEPEDTQETTTRENTGAGIPGNTEGPGRGEWNYTVPPLQESSLDPSSRESQRAAETGGQYGGE
jgi:transposase